MTNFQLVYCAANQNTADHIDQTLAKADISFNHWKIEGDDFNPSLYQQIKDSEGTKIFLLSDNFLKSSQCMYGVLPTFQEMNSSGKLITVVTEGEAENPQGGQINKVPTSFDRVSDVIQYMNFWQEQYLEMRKEKRGLSPDQENEFNEKLKIIRSISTQVGDFLRYLKGIDYVEYSRLANNDFEAFFKLTGNQSKYPAFASKMAAEKATEVEVGNASDTGHPKMQPTHAAPPADTPENQASVVENMEELSSKKEKNYDIIDQILADEENGKKERSKKKISDDLESIFEDDDTQTTAPTANSIDEIEELEVEELDVEIPDLAQKKKAEKPDRNELLGRVKTGSAEEVANAYVALLDDSPTDSSTRFDYACHLQDKMNDKEKATEQLELLVENDRKFVPAYLKLAEIAEQKNDYLLAKGYLEKAYSLDKNIQGIEYMLGVINWHYLEDKPEVAADYFKKAIQKNEGHVDSHYQYALLLNERLDNTELAIKHFKKTAKLDARHPFANYDLAIVYHRMGEHEIAANYYRKAYEINPELKTPENDRAFTVLPQARKKAVGNGNDISADSEMEVGVMETEQAQQNKEGSSIKAAPPKATERASSQAASKDTEAVITKTVMITGATSGIGKATAELFAKNGYRLILTGRRNERLDILKRGLAQNNVAKILTLSFDVRDEKAAAKACKNLPEEFKDIDILINNAGLAKGYAPIHEGNLEHWETMIDTNIKGLLYMTRLISPQMVKRHSGHIINICSTAGTEVYPNGNVYCATKFAVDALTKSMRLDLYKHGIRVSQVSPGHVEETEFAEVRFDGNKERAKIYDDFQPLKSKDVAEAIYFIATRPAYVNVQDILMMGSQQAGNNHIDRSGR